MCLCVWFGVEIAPPDPVDVLPRAKCEEALRAARQARWFEVLTYLLNYVVTCLTLTVVLDLVL